MTGCTTGDNAGTDTPTEGTIDTPKTPPDDVAKIEIATKVLGNLAKIGSTVVDGDECTEIVTKRSQDWLFKVHPDDRWFGSDNYDVDIEKFIRTKKLLIRLAELADFPVDCNLWMRTRDKPEKIGITIRQKHSYWHFYRFGQLTTDIPEQLLPVFNEGKTVVVVGINGDRISVFAPLRDGLGDIIGAIEASTRLRVVE